MHIERQRIWIAVVTTLKSSLQHANFNLSPFSLLQSPCELRVTGKGSRMALESNGGVADDFLPQCKVPGDRATISL